MIKKFLVGAGCLAPLATFAQDAQVTIDDLGLTDYVSASQTTIESVLTSILSIAFGIAVVYIGYRLYKRFVK